MGIVAKRNSNPKETTSRENYVGTPEKQEAGETDINVNSNSEEDVKNLAHPFHNREKDKLEEHKEGIIVHLFKNAEN